MNKEDALPKGAVFVLVVLLNIIDEIGTIFKHAAFVQHKVSALSIMLQNLLSWS